MNSLPEMIKEKVILGEEIKEFTRKAKEVEHLRKVALAANNESQVSTLTAEGKVVSETLQELNKKFHIINENIASQQASLKAEAKNYNIFGVVAIMAAIPSFWMSAALGVTWFVICLAISIGLGNMSKKSMSRSFGLTDEQIAEAEKEFKAKRASEELERQALAKAIADELTRK